MANKRKKSENMTVEEFLDMALAKCAEMSAKVEEIGEWTDEYGVKYSADKTILISGENVPENYTIIDECTTIRSCAFECCDMTSITIPESVKKIGDATFANCGNLQTIFVDKKNKHYSSVDGVLFNKRKTKLISFPGGKDDGDFIPEGVKSISSSAFMSCHNLMILILPDSVKSIGNGAFYWCKNMLAVFGNGITKIGDLAFEKCEQLFTIDLPDSLKSLGNWTFRECINLKSITIPNGVKSIGDGLFLNCSSLETVTIPDSVTSIGYRAFSGCSKLKKITIPNSVKRIGAGAFEDCSSLRKIVIPKSVKRIGDGAFSGCSKLKTVPKGYNNSQLETHYEQSMR